ncbi:hypothetical protein ACLOJK_000922 [Asimina triloba]
MSESGLNELKESGVISISGKVMFAAVIILFITIIFVLFLHLYARWFWGSSHPPPRSRSSRNPRRLAFAPAPDSALAPRRGLDLSLMRALPVVVFSPGDFKDGLECAVCLCEVSDGEKVRLLPKCNHGFHLDCIDMWFQSHSTCPLCRNPVAALPPPPAPDSSEPESRIPEPNAADGHSSESPNYPTNILFWGDQNQVSTGRSSGSEDGIPPPSSASAVSRAEGNAAVAIDIPRPPAESHPSPSSPAVRFQEEEPPKSPGSTRLRSLKRLLSREKRVVPCGNSAGDIEQGMGGG